MSETKRVMVESVKPLQPSIVMNTNTVASSIMEEQMEVSLVRDQIDMTKNMSFVQSICRNSQVKEELNSSKLNTSR